MTPPLPIVAIFFEIGIVILTDEYPWDYATLYGYIKHKVDDTTYYDKDGFKWRSDIYAQKPSFVIKLFAKTIYNPSIKVERTWIKIGQYELPELIETVNRCIDMDDDVLTQFIDASELKAKVSQCETFDGLVKVLFDYVFKRDPGMTGEVD